MIDGTQDSRVREATRAFPADKLELEQRKLCIAVGSSHKHFDDLWNPPFDLIYDAIRFATMEFT